MAITYALMQRLEELAETEPERVQIIKKARVTGLNKEGNTVTGVTYEFNGEKQTLDGPVVLATGGYAADFTDSSLLKKHRPDTYGLATTNGSHATGDGQKMVMAIGGNGIDMDKVQVHPTGLVDPKDPGSKWKFLAAEALRGEGGLLLNADGDRFCDELGHRDYVSGMMWKEKDKGKFPIRLILNSAQIMAVCQWAGRLDSVWSAAVKTASTMTRISSRLSAVSLPSRCAPTNNCSCSLVRRPAMTSPFLSCR